MAPETPATTLREPRGGGARPGNGELRGVRGRVFVNRGRAMSRIERVSYRSGFVKRLRESRHLPAITFEVADLPEDVVALVDAHLLDLGGTYGVPEAGDPIQYEELRIEHDQGDVEIVVYNRAILLFMTDSEAVKRIHQVCCRFVDIATRRQRRAGLLEPMSGVSSAVVLRG